MPRLGQHFLRNKSAIKKIIEVLDVQPCETVIESGSGHGELTLLLAKKCAEVGSEVIAIERDRELGDRLEVIGESEKIQNLKIIKGDALKLLVPLTSHLPPRIYKLCGNIPYYITGHLLRAVGNLGKRPLTTVLTIQKEVGERLVASTGEMNRLAAMVQIWSAPRIIARLPKEDFHPAPNVDSVIIKIEAKSDAPTPEEQKKCEQAVKTLFQQPRKTILNNLSVLKAIKKEKVASELQKINVNPLDRPQNLSLEDIKRIAEVFFAA